MATTSPVVARRARFDYRPPVFSRDILAIDVDVVVDRLARQLRADVIGRLRRRGIVLGISGGIDSSVVAALAARAVGPENVLGVAMPERHSSGDAERLAELLARSLGIQYLVEPVTDLLDAAGCYRRQDEAIRAVFPDHVAGDAFKVVLPPLLERDRLNIPLLAVAGDDGQERRSRIPLPAYLQLVAATNFKQRTRKMIEYYHADRLNFAVAGTPNRLEHDQGFFVKQGDGLADVKPIAHLYKSQVFAIAEHLGVPAEIRTRPPTTDTYPLAQSQEEFFFGVAYHILDLCLWAVDHDVPAAEAARVLDLEPDEVERVYRDIAAKRRSARYLHDDALSQDPEDAVTAPVHAASGP